MTDPDQVDRWRETFRLAHEAIYDIHRRLVVTRVATDHTSELLAESALIATTKGPRLTESARSLAIEYIDRSVMHAMSGHQALHRAAGMPSPAGLLVFRGYLWLRICSARCRVIPGTWMRWCPAFCVS